MFKIGFRSDAAIKRKIARTLSTEVYQSVLTEIFLKYCYPHLKREDCLKEDSIKKDLQQHLNDRILYVEKHVIPWIAESFNIKKKTVLEIGCGTGSMTIPFAMRVKEVIACDVWGTIEVAKERANQFNCDNIKFIRNDPNWLNDEKLTTEFFEDIPQYDIVALDAVIEHLTIKARIALLRCVWEGLKIGGILVVYETPNRLSYFDSHTYLTHFFHSLPDELARLYAKKFSSREDFVKELGHKDWLERLYRSGRGVSYHEFELAIDFKKASVLNDGFSKYLMPDQEHDYYGVLREIFKKELPHIPKAFSQEWINLILKKELV